MATVIIEQFNPMSGYWNKLYEVDQNDFDPTEKITVNKYNGQYRTRLVGISNDIKDDVKNDSTIKKEVIKKRKVSKSKKRKENFFHSLHEDVD